MFLRRWLRPPRHLVVMFLGIALVLAVALTTLAWRLFDQDRALERQRLQVRLEHAADVVAAELGRRLSEVEDRLGALAILPAPALGDSALRLASAFCSDAVVVAIGDDALFIYPHGRLAWVPVSSDAPPPDPRAFAAGESLEFRRGDLPAAARAYRRLTRSPDSLVRASAFMRLARVDRKAGRLDAALEAYDSLRALDRTPVNGLPAELVARHASLEVLEALGREDTLRERAARLEADLRAGRWPLRRAQYAFYRDETCRRTSCVPAREPTEGEALAGAVERLWNGEGARGEVGSELVPAEGGPVLVVWRRAGGRLVALVGGARHLTDDWISGLQPLLRDENVAIGFADPGGRTLTPPPGSARAPVITRSVAETRLPWTLRVASADPSADFAQLLERRRLMLAGLVTLALLMLLGLAAVLRGVHRELAVAGLQADFVAAVSHEFRTPLTSLRQMAEMLSSGRVTSDERRSQYYGVMERESGRLHRLVEGLLDFGRMEAGALEFNRERLAPDDLMRRVVDEFADERGSDDVTFTADPTVPAVHGDAEALGRAVWNLLDNAVKYSPGQPTIRVELRAAGRHVAIAVRDRGVGIPPAERRVIFDKFVRGTSLDGHGPKGTGIGLAMVKHIVEAHGGTVEVESEVGAGSTFTILLPAVE